MHKLSSNFTLFWKIFFPVFFLTMLYLLGFVMLFAENDAFFLFSSTTAKVIYWISMIFILIIFYFTILNIKRVEFDNEYFYITNFFKTIRIPAEGIEYIKLSSLPLLFSKIILTNKSTFGKTITFIPDKVGVSSLKSIHSGLIK